VLTLYIKSTNNFIIIIHIYSELNASEVENAPEMDITELVRLLNIDFGGIFDDNSMIGCLDYSN